uniref:Uncharacterized protein n=1 Tax=Setaria italica TaxID=4555 RepID=K3ZGU7_SETIT
MLLRKSFNLALKVPVFPTKENRFPRENPTCYKGHLKW